MVSRSRIWGTSVGRNYKKAVLSQGTTARCRTFVQKLAPNPRATQWIERTLKLSANIGNLSKNHFTSASVKDWCMSPHGIRGPPDKSLRNSGNNFRLARPQRRQISSRSEKNVRDIRCRKILLPEKSHSRSPDLSPIDRPYKSSYRHWNSVVTLALDCFVSEISLFFYRKCHFSTYPSSFITNLEMFP